MNKQEMFRDRIYRVLNAMEVVDNCWLVLPDPFWSKIEKHCFDEEDRQYTIDLANVFVGTFRNTMLCSTVPNSMYNMVYLSVACFEDTSDRMLDLSPAQMKIAEVAGVEWIAHMQECLKRWPYRCANCDHLMESPTEDCHFCGSDQSADPNHSEPIFCEVCIDWHPADAPCEN